MYFDLTFGGNRRGKLHFIRRRKLVRFFSFKSIQIADSFTAENEPWEICWHFAPPSVKYFLLT